MKKLNWLPKVGCRTKNIVGADVALREISLAAPLFPYGQAGSHPMAFTPLIIKWASMRRATCCED
jgi:hypothetical protein